MIKSKGKEVKIMVRRKIIFANVLKKATKKMLKRDANSTTCGVIYQPKVPAKLNEFKKINKE